MPRVSFRMLCLVTFLAALAGPIPVHAQYFGRNKVQYDRLPFRRLRTEHFDVYAYPSEDEGARQAARLIERWYERHARTFQRDFAQRKPFVLYADQPDFQQTNVTEGTISEGTGGFTEPLKDRVVLPLTGSLADDDHVIGHELVHAFQFDLVQGGRGGMSGLGGLPLWFVEGMAEYLSIGRVDTHTAMWLRDAVRRDDVPTLRQLSSDSRYFPYRFGQGLVAYIAGRWGTDAVVELLRVGTRAGMDQAFQQVLRMPGDTLVARWTGDLRAWYGPTMEGRTPPDSLGRRVLGSDAEDRPLYVAPAVSPDGRYVTVLSSRDLFTIDLYLAEVATGRIVGRLASASTDPHLDALRFVESSGSWSPDQRRFAYVGYAQGENEIVVADVERRSPERRYRTPGVGSVQNLAWSPDGATIAFSGTVGGVSDLFLLDVSSGSTERLTDDRYADLQPAWSPDGTTLAYVTDEGPGTDLALLSAGRLRIGLMTLDGERGRRIVAPFDDAKHISPQFSPDGARLYFISDADGFSDVYALELASGAVSRLTRVATGVSGITASAPALTVAAGSGDILVGVFDRAGYYVHQITAAGTPAGPAASGPRPGRVLPPAGPDRVSEYLANPSVGLTGDPVESVSDYRPHLGLSYLMSPQIGIAADRFGTQLGGAVGAVFSDLLETREVGAAVIAQGDVRDIAGQAFFVNKERRLRWGVSGGHIPYRSDFATFGTRPVQVGADSVIADVYDLYTQRIYQDRLGVGGFYPLSTTRRLEAGVTGTRLAYGLRHEEFVLAGSGAVVQRRVEDLPVPDPLYFAEASTAYVTDNSFFGFTSPIRGTRSRYEVGITRGDLDFITILGDRRRYLFRNPATLAFRALHYGRYTGDSDSNRIAPLFLGYETLVRGYAPESFEVRECVASPAVSGTCPGFDRLQGSRLAVANVELRVAFLGVEQLGLVDFPYLPTELALFADAGAAWGIGDDLELKWATRTTERVPVASVGATARVNVLGALVLEIYYAYPFQRPDKGWHFGFNVAPGW